MNFTVQVLLTVSESVLRRVDAVIGILSGGRAIEPTVTQHTDTPVIEEPVEVKSTSKKVAVAKGFVGASEKPVAKVKPEVVEEVVPDEEEAEEVAPKKVAQATKKSGTVTIEEVRAALDKKAKDGYRSECKALIASYGVKSLLQLDGSCYGDLLEKLDDL
jgi:hypothetical protein